MSPLPPPVLLPTHTAAPPFLQHWLYFDLAFSLTASLEQVSSLPLFPTAPASTSLSLTQPALVCMLMPVIWAQVVASRQVRQLVARG